MRDSQGCVTFLTPHLIHAQKLRDVVAPEEKRKIIGDTFMRVSGVGRGVAIGWRWLAFFWSFKGLPHLCFFFFLISLPPFILFSGGTACH